jgi:predicted SnoaL-like aldol condensation-catalyzing enzyme
VTRRTPPAHGSSLQDDASNQVLAQIDAHRGHSGEHSDEHWDGIRRLETGDTNPAF